MKKKTAVFLTTGLSLLVLAFTLTGCSASHQLSSEFNEATVKSTSESVVNLANSGDYQKISDTMVSDTLKTALSADVLKNAVSPVLDKAGEFDSISSDTVAGAVDSKTKKEYAVSIVIAKYKNQTVQYTISFGTDMKIEGFYIK